MKVDTFSVSPFICNWSCPTNDRLVWPWLIVLVQSAKRKTKLKSCNWVGRLSQCCQNVISYFAI